MDTSVEETGPLMISDFQDIVSNLWMSWRQQLYAADYTDEVKCGFGLDFETISPLLETLSADMPFTRMQVTMCEFFIVDSPEHSAHICSAGAPGPRWR